MTYSQQGVQNFVLDSHDDGGGGRGGSQEFAKMPDKYVLRWRQNQSIDPG